MTRLELVLNSILLSQVVIATGARFWTVKGAVAICAALVFGGWLIDWLLLKQQKETVFIGLAKLRNNLAATTTKEWLVNIAIVVMLLWDALLKAVSVLFFFTYLTLSRETLKSYLDRRVRVDRPDARPFMASLSDFFKRGGLFLLLMALWWVAIFTLNLWYVKISAILAVAFLLGVPANKMTFEMEHQSSLHIRRHRAKGVGDAMQSLLGLTVVLPLYLLLAVILLSTSFSVIAMAVGCAMANATGVSSYWFSTINGAVPNHPFILVLVNFLFDLPNVGLSLVLLTKVINKRKGFMVAALIGVLVSTTLTLIKFTVLRLISGSPGSIWIQLSQAGQWLFDLIRFRSNSLSPDWPLTPVLLTSFIIVTTYMAVFILLGLILKPLTRVAGHICEVLGQNKDKTPFLQLSMLLSMIVGVVKALGEWDWLVEKWPF